MAGDARLPHSEDVLQFGDGQLLLLEEHEEAQPGRVGEEAKKVYG